MAISQLPEIQSLHDHRSLVRIPPEEDIPLTPRVKRLIDTAPFRRLSRISQLGLVSLVYPAAHHTRFEHSLGTYRLALLSLDQLSSDPRFQQLVDTRDAGIFLAAALGRFATPSRISSFQAYLAMSFSLNISSPLPR